MRLIPKTDKELAEANLWPVGLYGFEIIAAQEAQSKSGNDMIKCEVKVFNPEGQYRVVYDYLLEANPRKLRDVAVVCGLEAEYKNGNLEAHLLVGKTGVVKLKIEIDKTGAYPDKNAIAEYCTAALHTPDTTKSTDDPDDEIPF